MRLYAWSRLLLPASTLPVCAWLVTLLGLGLLAQGCAHGRDLGPKPYETASQTFPSGMRVVVYVRPDAPVTSLHVSYGVGAVDDPEGQEGLANLAQVLTLYSRPEGPGSPQLGERLGAVGAERFSAVESDETVFSEKVRPVQLERLLELEALRLRAPLEEVSEAEFGDARHRVAELLGNHARELAAPELLLRHLLPGHPYGRPMLGTAESVESITFDAVRSWVRAHYTPDRVVLVVSGPLAPAEVIRAVSERFGPLATSPVSGPPAPAAPPLPELKLPKGLLTQQLDVKGPQLWLGWRLPGRKSGEFAQSRVLVENLRSLILPFLVAAAHQPPQRQSTVGAWDKDGVSILYATIELERAEDAERVLAALDSSMTAMWGEGGYGGHQTAKDLKLQVFAQALRDVVALPPSAVAKYLRTTGGANFAGQWPREVAQMSLHDIRSCVRKYGMPEHAYGMLVLPRNRDARSAP